MSSTAKPADALRAGAATIEKLLGLDDYTVSKYEVEQVVARLRAVAGVLERFTQEDVERCRFIASGEWAYEHRPPDLEQWARSMQDRLALLLSPMP